jgi:hypothetical protein
MHFLNKVEWLQGMYHKTVTDEIQEDKPKLNPEIQPYL